LDRIIEASKEFQALRGMITRANHSEQNFIINKMAEMAKNNGFSVTLCDRKSIIYKRSLGLRILIESNSDKGISTSKELVLSLSLLTPIFFLELVERREQEGVILEEGRVLDLEIPDAFGFIQVYLNSQGYARINSINYQKKIPEIAFLEIELGEFTYFNGLFGNTVGDLMF
jgi:hypothetical protein